MKTLFSLLITLSAITHAFASDVTGHWIGNIQGQYDISYDFKMDGDKLTGSTAGPEGMVIAIKDALLKDDDISWSIEVMGATIKVKGKVIENVMKLSFTYDGNDMTFELKKTDK